MRQKLRKIFSCILIQVFLLLPSHCFAAGNRDTLAPYLNITRSLLKKSFVEEGINLALLKHLSVSFVSSNRPSKETVELVQAVFGNLIEDLETEELDVDREFDNFLKECIKASGAAYGSILLREEGRPYLQFSYSTGLSSQRLKYLLLPEDMGISGQVMREGRPVIVNEYQSIPAAVDDFTGMKSENLLAFPIIINNEVIGVLELINRPGGFTAAEIEKISALFRAGSENIRTAVQFQEQKEQFLRACINLAEEIEAKNLYTGGHVLRVKKYALMIVKEMKLTRKEIEEIQIAAVLHDVGKNSIPDDILNKQGSLTEQEFETIKTHTHLGAEYLYTLYIENVRFRDLLNRFVNFGRIIEGVLYHHERPDGNGYPLGLLGDKIPSIAKIIAVADIFDALTSDRPYHKGIGFAEAMAVLDDLKELQVCQEVVEALRRALYKEKDLKTIFYFEDLIEEALSNDPGKREAALNKLNEFKDVKVKRFERSYMVDKGQAMSGFWELSFLLGVEKTNFVLDSVIYNTLKYGKGAAVVVVRRIEENKVRLIIQDDGPGVDLSGLAPRLSIHNPGNGEDISRVESTLWKLLDLIVKTHKGRVIVKSQDKLKVFYPSKGENGWHSRMVDVSEVNMGLRIEIEIPLSEEFLKTKEPVLRKHKRFLADLRSLENSI